MSTLVRLISVILLQILQGRHFHFINGSVICDENDELICSESTILCQDTICEFNCPSDRSCNNTIFHCIGADICTVTCEGINSCESSYIVCESDECTVYGIGNLSLKHAAIFSKVGDITVNCIGTNSCHDAKVNPLSYNTTNVSCIGSGSCFDLLFHCSMRLKPGDNKKCNLIGRHTDEKIKINLKSYDSWNNINIEGWNSNNILNNSVMICGSKDNCTFGGLNDAEWDCHSETSKCSLTYLNDDLHIIKCDENNHCRQKELECDIQKKCIVQCNSFRSCEGAVIRSNYDTLGLCNIQCNGFESCISTDIICRDDCNITVGGEYAMYNASLTCGYGDECDISCTNKSSCSNAFVKGSDAKIIDFYCENGGCSDMNIWCPKYITWDTKDYTEEDDYKNCILKGTGDIHRYLNIYARDGFKYVDVDNYEAIFIENGSNKMHCGFNYKSSCVMDSSDFCVCEDEDIYTPYTPGKGNNDIESTLIIIGCTVGGIICLASIVGLGILYVEKKKEKYKSIETL